tara:strand:- start:869 stop:1027 length:159 start_codon:yes stop_codon:yes gene_type:complete
MKRLLPLLAAIALPTAVNAAKWMGHSPEIHSKIYQSGYDEGDILAVAENLNL